MVALGSKPGGYELVAELGYGGMATLFLARRDGAQGFARLAAVKVVHPHLAKQDRFRRMFVDEAKISAEVVHPNVVRVEDFGEHDGTFFMAMEYVHGCSLADFLHALARRHNRLIPEVVVHLGAEIAAGLHAAHEAKDRSGRKLDLVHRDVSPSNVLLSYDGHVKLIDFGVAKAKFRTQQTEAASLKGKIAYMSPEQANGSDVLDRRTDVYALGLVLWEMLTMRRAFQGANEVQLLKKVQSPKLPPPSTFAPTPQGLDDVVMQALSVDPDLRYPDMLSFRRALLAACPGALGSDSNTVADLLQVIMKEHRERQTSLIPNSVNEGLEQSVVTRGERSGERIGERLRNLMAEDRTIAGTWVEEVDDDDEPPTERYTAEEMGEMASEVRPIAEAPTMMVMTSEATQMMVSSDHPLPPVSGEVLSPPSRRQRNLPTIEVTGETQVVFLTKGRIALLFAFAAIVGIAVGSAALQLLLKSAEPTPTISASPLPPEADVTDGQEVEPTPAVDPSAEREPVDVASTEVAEPTSPTEATAPEADPDGTEAAPDEEADETEVAQAEETAAERRARRTRERWLRRQEARRRGSGGRNTQRTESALPLATGL